MHSKKIVLIMTDTQRHDMVSCYRETGLKTPCIDSIAKQGVRFASAYTTQPVCQPARAGIFTGMYPNACGSWTNSTAIGDNTRTIGQRLSDKGVHTAYIGKWHLDGSDYFGLGKCPSGWDADYWYDMRNYLDELSEPQRVFSRSAQSMLKKDISSEFTYAHRVTDRAVDFLKNFGGDDFFLTVSYDEPHDPSLCPREFWEQYRDFSFPKSENIYDTLENKPDYQRVWAGNFLNSDKESMKIQSPFLFGCNSYVDSQIGRVLEGIRQHSPDATVIYTADHGDFLCSHSLSGKGSAAYEEITHVPLIMMGPGIGAGMVDENPVSHINLAPTVFDLMGFDMPPEVFHGKSLVSELENQNHRTNDYIFMEFGRYEVDHDGFGGFQPMRAVFDGRYKLSVNLLSSDELYDLQEDSAEMKNLISSPDHTEIRDRLHRALLQNMNETRDTFRGYYWEYRPWATPQNPKTWGYTGMTRQRVDTDYESMQLDYSNGLEITEATRKK